MTGIDPLILTIVIILFGIFGVSLILNYFKMPSVVTYILAGIVIGPFGLNLIKNSDTISLFGSLGVLLLLFFIGMEISLEKLIKNWKISFVGGLSQVCLSLILTYVLGIYLDWSYARIIFLGFVISLSSTAVVLKLLKSEDILDSRIGQNVLSILLFQDILVIPMIIILNLLGGNKTNEYEIFLQLFGTILIIFLMTYIIKKKEIKINFFRKYKNDHEMQVFIALGICFGFSLMTGLFNLSTTLGAFIAGITISHIKETKWINEVLHSFYVVFVAIFFLSIGMIFDINFFFENYQTILILVIMTFFINTGINTISLIFLKIKFKEALYTGILLSQIGEFSYILAAIGINLGVINMIGYNYTISIITLTLLFTPLFIQISKKILKINIKSSSMKEY